MGNRKRLVVAKYHENIDWTSPAKSEGVDVIVYDKSNPSIIDPQESVNLSKNLIQIPNIGRESHTYLAHIVRNYDSLYDIEIFSQGDVSDHVIDFWGRVRGLVPGTFDFVDFPDREKIVCFNEKSYELRSSQHPEVDPLDTGSASYIFMASPGHREIYGLAHGECPENIDTASRKFSCHAVFAVSKECIRRIPLESYKKMLDLFSDPYKPYPPYKCVGDYWAYEFEYAWKSMFTGPFK